MNAAAADAAAMGADVAAFDRFLERKGVDYWLVGQSGDRQAHVRFSGRFQGKPVVWDCRVSTLAHAGASRNFIDIGEPGEHGVPLQVGLALSAIDRPAIEKMIIMIRNYKRLRRGRHTYG